MFLRSFFGAAIAATVAFSVPAAAQNLRLEVFVIEANNAVTAASAGKRPSQWEGPVIDLLFAGKAKTATCAKVAVVWFTHMFSKMGGKRVYHDIALGPHDLAKYVSETRRIERTGQKVTIIHRKVEEAGKTDNRYYQEVTVPLIDGVGAVFLPAAAISASANPIMGVALPGQTLRGLPDGNSSGIRWSTPGNGAFGSDNELHKALGRQYKNDSVVLIVPPC